MTTTIGPCSKRAAEERAYRLRDACESVVNAADGRVIHDADVLDPGPNSPNLGDSLN